MWPFKTGTLPAVLFAEEAYLRAPRSEDYQSWRDVRLQSQKFLKPWEPEWSAQDLTQSAFERRVARYNSERKADTGYNFFLFRAVDDALLGGVSLSAVQRGVMQNAILGYWMGEMHAGQGWMTKGVHRLKTYAFGTLGLHRIEAACLPHNKASIRLLEKSGFEREGYARKYLCIDGRWQDHVTYALLNPADES